jgi:hypothetical protein
MKRGARLVTEPADASGKIGPEIAAAGGDIRYRLVRLGRQSHHDLRELGRAGEGVTGHGTIIGGPAIFK